jgi:hypothetical protein
MSKLFSKLRSLQLEANIGKMSVVLVGVVAILVLSMYRDPNQGMKPQFIHDQPANIPLPATMVHEISKALNEDPAGVGTALTQSAQHLSQVAQTMSDAAKGLPELAAELQAMVNRFEV